jgi:hypothetical protein
MCIGRQKSQSQCNGSVGGKRRKQRLSNSARSKPKLAQCYMLVYAMCNY